MDYSRMAFAVVICVAPALTCLSCSGARRQPLRPRPTQTGRTGGSRRADWYWDSTVNLHVDNHSGLVGKGCAVDELVEMIRDIPVSMIQVSALGNSGWATYPTSFAPHVDLEGWDTLAVWREVARRLNLRFCVYINTRGLKLPKIHPEWMQQDATGRGRGRGTGLDICMRPSPDGSGALETMFVPLVSEIAARYKPDGLWVDGDHARTWTCYCANCKSAWEARTGNREPPKTSEAPDWADWLQFNVERFDEYRRQMAQAAHSAHPGCMYTSNHSWRFRSKDPRSVPEWVDTLSGDLSHGLSLRSTRLSAMQLSAEERVPHDIMHRILPEARRRILQLGAVTLSSGGPWFLWAPGSTIVKESTRTRARMCAEFAMARRDALGRSTSASPVAVLVSETSWARERLDGVEGAYDPTSAENVALALQDAGYGVDIVNEDTLLSRLGSYRIVVVANQKSVAERTASALRDFVTAGGQLLVTGAGLKPDAEPDETGREMLGIERVGMTDAVELVDLGFTKRGWRSVHKTTAQAAEVLARTQSGSVLLTRRSVGKGTAAYLAAPGVAYPEDDGLIAWVMQKLGSAPSVCVSDGDRHIVTALRRKAGQLVLHVTDLTSHVKGKRCVPALVANIDDEPPMPTLRLSIALPSRPKDVRVVPGETRAEADWEDGVLRLALRNVSIHAAVVIDAEAPEPLPALPASSAIRHPKPVDASFAEDFETYRPGAVVSGPQIASRTDSKTSITVTDETAAGGKRSLCFADHPQAGKRFLPYLVIQPQGLCACTARFSCDLRIEKDAEVQIELREVENAREFPVGPSILFCPDGQVHAPNRDGVIASFPIGEWFHVEICFRMDERRGYDLTLTRAGKEAQVFANLPFRSAEFWKCGWIGICSLGGRKATFFVDNLSAGVVQSQE